MMNKVLFYLVENLAQLSKQTPKDYRLFIEKKEELELPLTIDNQDDVTLLKLNICWFETTDQVDMFINMLKNSFREPNIFDFLKMFINQSSKGSYKNEDYDANEAISHSELSNMMYDSHMESIADFLCEKRIRTVFGSAYGKKPNKRKRNRIFNNVYVTKAVSMAKDAINKKNKIPDEIVLYLDTSGSMEIKDILLCIAVSKKLARMYPTSKVKTYGFSDFVYEITNLSVTDHDISQSGTNINAVREHMEANPSRIRIVVSDMDFYKVEGKLPDPCILVSVHDRDNAYLDDMKSVSDREDLWFFPPTVS